LKLIHYKIGHKLTLCSVSQQGVYSFFDETVECGSRTNHSEFAGNPV